jgi:5-methylcytosine-specific restriction endonuclease McrA
MPELKGEDFDPDDRPTAKRIRRLIEIQDFRCAMTGIELKPEDANLDHIIPVAAGGDHSMGNVQIVHRVINQMKSTLRKDAFIEWCRRVVAYADRRRTSK